jgi:hypothetical protein
MEARGLPAGRSRREEVGNSLVVVYYKYARYEYVVSTPSSKGFVPSKG